MSTDNLLNLGLGLGILHMKEVPFPGDEASSLHLAFHQPFFEPPLSHVSFVSECHWDYTPQMHSWRAPYSQEQKLTQETWLTPWIE